MKIWYVFLTLALTACASVEHTSNGTLYNEFQEYQAAVNLNDETAVRTKISKVYLDDMNERDKNIPSELGLDTPFWKYLAREIVTEYSHFENTDGEIGCLTINGLDKLDRPRSLSLYYIKENGNWVFNYSGLTAHDSIRGYYTKPTCPNPESF